MNQKVRCQGRRNKQRFQISRVKEQSDGVAEHTGKDPDAPTSPSFPF